MSTRLDTARVLAYAATLERAAAAMDSIRTRLDAAMRPVRRGDVPNLGSIEGTYGHASGALSRTKHSTGSMAAQLRQYVRARLEIELVMSRLLPQFRAHRFGAVPNRWVPGAVFGGNALGQLGFGATAADTALQPFGGMGRGQAMAYIRYQVVNADGTTSWVVARHNFTHGMPTTAGGALLAGAGKLVTVVGLTADTATLLSDDASFADQFGASLGVVSGSATLVQGGAGMLANAGMGGTAVTTIGTGATAVASWAGPAAATFTITYTYADYRRQQFEQDELNGVSSVERIVTSNRPVQVQAADLTLLGVHRASGALGSAYWNHVLDVPKYEPIATRPNWQNTAILAEIRKVYPNARLSFVDGATNVVIPAPSGADRATVITISNTSGRVG